MQCSRAVGAVWVCHDTQPCSVNHAAVRLVWSGMDIELALAGVQGSGSMCGSREQRASGLGWHLTQRALVVWGRLTCTHAASSTERHSILQCDAVQKRLKHGVALSFLWAGNRLPYSSTPRCLSQWAAAATLLRSTPHAATESPLTALLVYWSCPVLSYPILQERCGAVPGWPDGLPDQGGAQLHQVWCQQPRLLPRGQRDNHLHLTRAPAAPHTVSESGT